MHITKYEHACLDITEGDDRLVVDPGAFAKSLTKLDGIAALVITHVHQDHFDEAKVETIIAKNPTIQIFTTQEVANKLTGASATVASVGQEYNVGSFKLEFFGGEHAPVMPGFDAGQNYGVLINNALYYPGDSFTECPKLHKVLALPANGPWQKMSDTAAFLPKNSATVFFPTHNGFINEAGEGLAETLFGGLAKATGKTLHVLAVGQSLDV